MGWWERRLSEEMFVMWDLQCKGMRNHAFVDTYDYVHLDKEAGAVLLQMQQVLRSSPLE